MNDLTQKQSANFDLSALDLLDLGDAYFPEDKMLSAVPDGEKYIVFFLGTEIYAVLSKRVAEIFQPLAVTALPNTPLWLVGIANFRNEIISVIDLKKLWGKPGSPVSSKSKLIVLRPEAAGSPIAFAIDKLSEVVTLSEQNIHPISDQNSPCVYGKVLHKSNTLNLLDINNLLSSLSF